jgi:hypothetical protein
MMVGSTGKENGQVSLLRGPPCSHLGNAIAKKRAAAQATITSIYNYDPDPQRCTFKSKSFKTTPIGTSQVKRLGTSGSMRVRINILADSRERQGMPHISRPSGVRHLHDDRGSGKPIMFSHGWAFSPDAWAPPPQEETEEQGLLRQRHHHRRAEPSLLHCPLTRLGA